MRTDEVRIVCPRVHPLQPSVHLTQLVLVLFFRSPPDAAASSREMERSWPNSAATEGCWRLSFRGGPWAEPGRVGGPSTTQMRTGDGWLSGCGVPVHLLPGSRRYRCRCGALAAGRPEGSDRPRNVGPGALMDWAKSCAVTLT